MFLTKLRKPVQILGNIAACLLLFLTVTQAAQAKENPTPGDVLSEPTFQRAATGSGILPFPAYDTGWVTLASHTSGPITKTFIHKLGGNADNYWVDLMCWDETLGIYSCIDKGSTSDPLPKPNAYWRDLTANDVTVKVIKGIRPDKIRLRIFKENPIYDSRWVEVDPRLVPINKEFPDIGTQEPTHYIDLTCKNENNLNGCTGLENGSFQNVAYWYDYDRGWVGSTVLKVKVMEGDEPTHIRLRVYDRQLTGFTGYFPIEKNTGTHTFSTVDFFPWLPENYRIKIMCGYLESQHNQLLFDCQDSNFQNIATWFNVSDEGISIHAESLPTEDYYIGVYYFANYPNFLPVFLQQP